jgi:hypothetical protein
MGAREPRRRARRIGRWSDLHVSRTSHMKTVPAGDDTPPRTA